MLKLLTMESIKLRYRDAGFSSSEDEDDILNTDEKISNSKSKTHPKPKNRRKRIKKKSKLKHITNHRKTREIYWF